MTARKPKAPDPPPDTSAAFAAVEREREPRAYLVVGPRRVHDTDPGGEFTALFTPEQEAALIEGGHIEIKETP